MECAVASALMKNGYPLYYYSKPDSTLEIDFVTESEGTPLLIEVKSGRNKRAKSMSTLMREKDRKRKGYKIMGSNIETDDLGIVHLPLYAPCFFKEVNAEEWLDPNVTAIIRAIIIDSLSDCFANTINGLLVLLERIN